MAGHCKGVRQGLKTQTNTGRRASLRRVDTKCHKRDSGLYCPGIGNATHVGCRYGCPIPAGSGLGIDIKQPAGEQKIRATGLIERGLVASCRVVIGIQKQAIVNTQISTLDVQAQITLLYRGAQVIHALVGSVREYWNSAPVITETISNDGSGSQRTMWHVSCTLFAQG